MSWADEVAELERRRRIALAQGGEAGIEKQHAAGRLTIRERIDALLDAGSFREQGRATAAPEYDEAGELTGFTPANYVVGLGRINGRQIAVGVKTSHSRAARRMLLGCARASMPSTWQCTIVYRWCACSRGVAAA